jgi:hypothetical protein
MRKKTTTKRAHERAKKKITVYGKSDWILK